MQLLRSRPCVFHHQQAKPARVWESVGSFSLPSSHFFRPPYLSMCHAVSITQPPCSNPAQQTWSRHSHPPLGHYLCSTVANPETSLRKLVLGHLHTKHGVCLSPSYMSKQAQLCGQLPQADDRVEAEAGGKPEAVFHFQTPSCLI